MYFLLFKQYYLEHLSHNIYFKEFQSCMIRIGMMYIENWIKHVFIKYLI
jgi:hypothetical protein